MKGSDIALDIPVNCKVRRIPLKRLFDIFFSLFVLIAASPIFIILTLFIRLTSKGKAFYSQERIGRGGAPFKCYKFRTMHLDAEKRLNDLLSTNPEMKKEWEEKHKLTNDPRVTKMGKFLRKTSLDELPQFFNVLKGDLSVVGPRPVVYEEIQRHYGAKAYKILSIRPGLTCIWQISGRSDTSYQRRIQLDEQYVDRRSLLFDLLLIIKTIPKMISSKGAY